MQTGTKIVTDDAFIAYWSDAYFNGTDSMSWGDCANLTHVRQVGVFGWCSCEDNEGADNPYADCPSDQTVDEVMPARIV